MAAPILIPCLVQLRAEFDRIAPGRDHASDGWIGDAAHQREMSDHNDDEVGNVPIHDADHVHEVHAIDVDTDLAVPGLDMEQVVQFLLGRCRSGAENRLRYMIYNRRIWEADNGWKQKTYTGVSAHTEHGHFSASYDTDKEASTASWHLEDIPVALTDDDKKWLAAKIDASATAAAERVWATKLNVHVKAGEAPSMQPAGSILRYLSPEGAEERELIVGVGDGIAAVAADVKQLLAAMPPAGL
jgi:type VI protein secretion system component Hcp